jgi:hypothetical protein
MKIKDEKGREWKKQHGIGHAFTQFFQGLFSAGEVCDDPDGQIN